MENNMILTVIKDMIVFIGRLFIAFYLVGLVLRLVNFLNDYETYKTKTKNTFSESAYIGARNHGSRNYGVRK